MSSLVGDVRVGVAGDVGVGVAGDVGVGVAGDAGYGGVARDAEYGCLAVYYKEDIIWISER